MKILLIEDDPQMVDCYLMILEGHEVTVSIDRKVIEETWSSVDVVICDYDFNPRLKFEEVRDMINGRKPLILATGRLEDIYKVQLSKPFRAAELKGLIYKLVS